MTLSVCVQAKLEHYLPTATDSVLCDYVLVMVGNKKNSRQVALDLEVSPAHCCQSSLFCMLHTSTCALLWYAHFLGRHFWGRTRLRSL